MLQNAAYYCAIYICSRLQTVLEIIREFLEVSFVALREDEALHARPPRRDGLLLDPTDG